MLAINTFIPQNVTSLFNNRRTTTGSVYYSNLAPLKYDTVSFGLTEKDLPSKDIQGMFKLPAGTANKIYKNAKQTKNYLAKQLYEIFDGLISSSPNDGKPIGEIVCRTKLPKSIDEKAMTRRWINEDEVKSNMTDIIGARIIMNNSSVENVDKVIDRITDAVRNDKLRIIEIENYRPEPEIDENGDIKYSYDYASFNALRRLKCECDKKGRSIPKRDEDLPTGYMAIHLLTELPNSFTGEIQIMGKDVAKLKDIEDLCYKAKSGKKIDPIYKPIRDILKPLRNKNDVILQREYNKYTRNAYTHQRMKETFSNDDSCGFLKIPNYLPEELDFNNLARIKSECEKK